MIRQFKNRNFYIVLCADLVSFAVSLLLAYGIRFAFEIPPYELYRFFLILPVVFVVKTVVFALAGVYKGMWRYTSIPDAIRIGKASVISSLAIIAGLTLVHRFQGYPRSVYVADGIFTAFLCAGFRIGIRLLSTRRTPLSALFTSETNDSEHVREVRLIIVGAGDAAAAIIREIQGNRKSQFAVVACADDARAKHGQSLLDIPVCGPISRLPYLVRQCQADEILIAMPSVGGGAMRDIIATCKATGLPFKTLPSLSALADGRVNVHDVRDVNYEDLLGRSAVQLDWTGIGKCLAGKTVAVTGAGGSIGSELCRQIIRFKPAVIVLIEANEFNLYTIEKELRAEGHFEALRPALGRVQDRELMSHLFDKYRPHAVFHAAAAKHVPIVEDNPWEGVLNNTIGSQVLMDVAEEYGVERFVLVSSDKAVRPTSVMGATKRVAEIFLQCRKPGKTRFMAVRFGNVIGSSGSVLPLFEEQIRAGGPVTVTHAEMTRFFMTIPEACQLILQACAMGEGGEIFVLEMGTPVKINDMVRDMIRLSGKIPDEDIEIRYIGLRPGEKLFEELITHGEGIVATSHEKIMALRRAEDTAAGALEQTARTNLAMLSDAAATYDSARIMVALSKVVPEYTSSGATANSATSTSA